MNKSMLYCVWGHWYIIRLLTLFITH